ncbi:DUF1194 domain-containing protein [Mesobacterium sp. TK19101]|uniref:DUF1194 domain-containing protein n=1 Tax=Mesobacterium hydrothermale TaxID=3111907 RepID=A0ABU6HL52_9RHOB|nr:DUF1194 domain-containing protein [Mesobacterium sp. TK19101]MEC3863026.1 DUF1194 domain-containing protein [Mesobacterium sp. TK19101]
MKTLAVLLTLWAGIAQAGCRQALALALDISGSVDSREYALQINGLANALLHPEVQDALFFMPSSPVRLMVYQWSGPGTQQVILDWTDVDSAATLQVIVATIRGASRPQGDPSTAIGAALLTGLSQLSTQEACWKRTLDVSGDGKSNTGPEPQDIRPQMSAAGITVNGLVIGTGAGDQQQTFVGELQAYYDARVISGPDAFIETALSFGGYEAAMVRKLKRELQGQLFSGEP